MDGPLTFAVLKVLAWAAAEMSTGTVEMAGIVRGSAQWQDKSSSMVRALIETMPFIVF